MNSNDQDLRWRYTDERVISPQFGAIAQRVGDESRAEIERANRALNLVLAGFVGFLIAMVLCGALTFWKLGVR